MKYINERTIEIIKDNKPCTLYIEEYSTIYKVTAKFVGWALPFLLGESFKKKNTTEQNIIDYVTQLKIY